MKSSFFPPIFSIESQAAASSAFCVPANRVETMPPHQLRKQSVATNESSDYSPLTNSKHLCYAP